MLDTQSTGAGGMGTGRHTASLTLENLAFDSAEPGLGSDDPDDTINVGITVVDNRPIGTNDPHALIKTLVGHEPTAPTSVTIETSGADDHFTRVSTTGGSVNVDNDPARPVAASFGEGAVTFDDAGALNGTYCGQFHLQLQNDQGTQGTSANDLGPRTWNLIAEVSGNSGGGSAQISSGEEYDGYSATSDLGGGTQVELLDGTASNDTELNIVFEESGSGSTGGEAILGDVVDVSGTGNDQFVLQLGYTDAAVTESGVPEQNIRLMWQDSTGTFVNAVEGNSDGGAGADFYAGPYLEYLNALGAPSLSDYGLDMDNNKVWAVLDHNSPFAAATPEPASLGLLVLAIATLCGGRPKRA